MIKDIVNFLLIAGTVQGFLFIFVTFSMRKKIEKPVVYLNLVIGSLSLNNLQAWLIEKGFIFENAFLRNYEVPWYLLIVPTFYAFTINFLSLTKALKSYFRITFGLFVIELIIRALIIVWFLPGNESFIKSYTVWEELFNALYSLCFFYMAIRTLYGPDRKFVTDFYKEDARWLRNFIIAGMVVIGLWFLAIASNLYFDPGHDRYYYPLRISSSVLLYYLGYRGFIKFTINQDRLQLRSVFETAASPTYTVNSYQFGGKQEEKLHEINRFMNEQRPFLNPLYGLDDLAEDIGISANYTSQIINQVGGKHYADFINEFRVKEAQKLLVDPEFSDYTIVSIGLECGFNSKSSFYTAFKKHTGHTPSYFRKY